MKRVKRLRSVTPPQDHPDAQQGNEDPLRSGAHHGGKPVPRGGRQSQLGDPSSELGVGPFVRGRAPLVGHMGQALCGSKDQHEHEQQPPRPLSGLAAHVRQRGRTGPMRGGMLAIAHHQGTSPAGAGLPTRRTRTAVIFPGASMRGCCRSARCVGRATWRGRTPSRTRTTGSSSSTRMTGPGGRSLAGRPTATRADRRGDPVRPGGAPTTGGPQEARGHRRNA